MALSAKAQAYMTASATLLASLGAAVGTIESGLVAAGTPSNSPILAILGFVALGIGLILKYEKQIQAIGLTPEFQTLAQSLPADWATLKQDFAALKLSHATLQAQVATALTADPSAGPADSTTPPKA